jgi:hypothetical protein
MGDEGEAEDGSKGKGKGKDDEEDEEPDFMSADGACQWDPTQLWRLIKSQAYNKVVGTYFPPFDSSGLQDIVRVAVENYAKDSMEASASASDNTGELIINQNAHFHLTLPGQKSSMTQLKLGLW